MDTRIRTGDTRAGTGPVVVGVDLSPGAREAAVWAADLAARWDAPLRLLHVVAPGAPVVEVPPWLGSLRDAVARPDAVASRAGPPRAEVLRGSTVEAIAARAVDARLLVLGSYGEGARSGMLAGSVALALLGLGTCPVAVVRGSAPQQPPPHVGPVVVGVDGSPAGRFALEFATVLAVALGERLLAVHSWTEVAVGVGGGVRRRPEDPATLARDATALLDRELGAVTGSGPNLRVEREVVGDSPVRALLERARGARLIVVGHRAHPDGGDLADGSDAGMLAGSTSRSLVEFASCPVVVV